MMKKVKPVLDTSYEPYFSGGNQEDNNKPEFYRTVEGQLVLKKVADFYNKVPIPCMPVINQNPGIREGAIITKSGFHPGETIHQDAI
ncbi:hypothetical protein DSO57_1010590 [Entomophthora muscae]|uniref:Uncharacterized protein n=1 Tax=Entomophthora muscae TaxID=34485 RepID=A0ACC2UG64_9FUNG|nr:hypothetical protein DSO57_1010590 [Entomophthora muscae]